ncbi:uncharacterized protein [Diadema setosum]|uniref:uncharacterized protein n=1 Tax=Diadema setosum TaxID=31175 RepID=UPI003B3A7333
MTLLRITRTKPKVLFGLFTIILLSFATVIIMVDLTSSIVSPGTYVHRKKSALSLFTNGNTSGIRNLLSQISSYRSDAVKLKSAFPTFRCGRPPYSWNTTEVLLSTDTSFITLDDLTWRTFGDELPGVGKLSRLSNQIRRELNKTEVLQERNQTIDEIFREHGLFLGIRNYLYLPGGHWKPKRCTPKWKVAIIIPFRDRLAHLAIFVRHMIPFLQRQNLEFTIFVVEQNNDKNFNRAMLLNVGFVEALKLTKYDCFIFHDVDHLPININNYYGCDHMPRHFISGEDTWGYTLMYQELFGGVTGLTRKQMYDVNGFSNVYWGWGGEDDDFFNRIQQKGYYRTRPAGHIGFYNTIPHGHKAKDENFERFCLLHFGSERTSRDGLSNLVYDDPVVELTPLFTKISVDIKELPWKTEWVKCSEVRDMFNPEMYGAVDPHHGSESDLDGEARPPNGVDRPPKSPARLDDRLPGSKDTRSGTRDVARPPNSAGQLSPIGANQREHRVLGSRRMRSLPRQPPDLVPYDIEKSARYDKKDSKH